MRDVRAGYESRPIVVVGAGAAGLAAAIDAADEDVPVLVLEATSDGGRKILISGGGRCNVLPAALEPARFVSEGPAHLVRHLLRSWPLAEQHRFFEEEVGIPLALEAESRKYFPASNRARDVRDGLVALARRRGVTFRCRRPRHRPRAGQRRRLVAVAGQRRHRRGPRRGDGDRRLLGAADRQRRRRPAPARGPRAPHPADLRGADAAPGRAARARVPRPACR